MEFTNPTTKTEMFSTLGQIFTHYRVNNTSYTEPDMDPVVLQRLEFTPKTDEELENIATLELASAHRKETDKYKADLFEQQLTLLSQKQTLQTKYDTLIAKVQSDYEQSKKTIESESVKKSIFSASYVLDKIALLEKEKVDKMSALISEKDNAITQIESKLDAINTLIENADAFYQTAHDFEIQAKVNQLKENQDKTVREVFKYNNALDEKEQRSINTITETSATLKLKYLELSGLSFTKNQLVEMGYYNDVIACVCAYYNTLTPVDAYNDIVTEGRLSVYLDDYYEQVLVMYKARYEMTQNA